MRIFMGRPVSLKKISTVAAAILIVCAIILPARTAAAGQENLVREALLDHLSGTLEWDRIEVESVRVNSGVELPGGAYVEVLGEIGSNLLGRRSFRMLASYKSKEKKFRASADVRAYGRVYYLSRPIMRGEPVDPGELISQKMDLRRIARGAVSDPAELAGLVAARPVGVNVVLKKTYFKEVPLAQKGERVLILADSDVVRVAVPGVLKTDGYKGRMVKVINLMSRKEVQGWLVDSGTVKVNF